MQLRQIYLLIVLLSASDITLSLQPESVDKSCVVNFALSNPNKTVTLPWDAEQLTCKEAQKKREDIYVNELSRYSSYSTNSEIRDAAIQSLNQSLSSIDTLSSQIAIKEGEVTQAEIDGLLSAQMANAAVAAGLIACAETLGGGCLFAGVSAIYGSYDAVRSFQTIEDLQTDINTLRNVVTELKSRATSLESKLLDGRQHEISEFNRFCFLIKEYCQ